LNYTDLKGFHDLKVFNFFIFCSNPDLKEIESEFILQNFEQINHFWIKLMVIVPSRCSHTVLKRQLVLLTYTVLMVPNIYFRFLIGSTKKDSTKSACTAFDDFIDYQREKMYHRMLFLSNLI